MYVWPQTVDSVCLTAACWQYLFDPSLCWQCLFDPRLLTVFDPNLCWQCLFHPILLTVFNPSLCWQCLFDPRLLTVFNHSRCWQCLFDPRLLTVFDPSLCWQCLTPACVDSVWSQTDDSVWSQPVLTMFCWSQVEEIDEKLVRCLSNTARGCLAPLCATIGGIVAQEGLKALTGKFLPLDQWVSTLRSTGICTLLLHSCFWTGG